MMLIKMDQLVEQLKNNRMSYTIKMELIMNTLGLENEDFSVITHVLGYKPGFTKFLKKSYYEYEAVSDEE